ncbi:MAG: glyoxalase [Chitinophagaceae bacterium]|nr:MAG: glyoxalase [Chitinophagaceae bacterium]
MNLSFTKVKETCLYVKDLSATKDFYHKKLGLPVITEVENRHIFFRAGESVLLCFISESTKEDKNLPPHFGEGKMHYALECKKEEYLQWKAFFQKKNIPIIHEEKWGRGFESFYFEDPEKHVGEIVMKGMWGD